MTLETKKSRILIVEDETVVAMDINYTLIDLGYEIHNLVVSAESALKILEDNAVDLVLMDIHLKGQMTGIEAAKVIREKYDIPVIFLTAYSDESTLAQARITEPYGYILKPFTKRELSSNIEIALYKHQMESKIRASEQRWNSLIANAPNIITIIGPDEKLQYSNKYPMSDEELHKVDIFSFILPEFHEMARASIQKGFQGEQTSYEVRAQLPEGNTAWLETRIGPILERDKVVAVTLISTDITDRKLAEIEREGLMAELMAKNEELDSFTYGVSHDLKAPLMTIQGFLGYLKKDAMAGNLAMVDENAARIDEAVNKMQNMLTALLELSRVGRLTNPPEKVPLKEIVREATTLIKGRLNERRVKVVIKPNLPDVYGNRQRLVQVFQNLIENSAKYIGDQKKPQIEIGVKKNDDGLPFFYVRDNGIGIAPENQERIFEMFRKLDGRMDGTGVGLSLVKRIIEQHGGRIWVESALGTGSTFNFTLPSTSHM
jgi:PAS domain S-box-containing protein